MAIENRIADIKFNARTKNHIKKLYSEFGAKQRFGRGDISDTCGMSYSAAGSLIDKMKKHKLIEEVKGYGKGKYCFVK